MNPSHRNLVKTKLWQHQREDADKLEDQARVLCANGMGTLQGKLCLPSNETYASERMHTKVLR